MAHSDPERPWSPSYETRCVNACASLGPDPEAAVRRMQGALRQAKATIEDAIRNGNWRPEAKAFMEAVVEGVDAALPEEGEGGGVSERRDSDTRGGGPSCSPPEETMSNYERAVALEREHRGLIEALERQRATGLRDKTGLRAWAHGLGRGGGGHPRLTFSTEMYHGTYGCSSTYNDGSERAAQEIAKTLAGLRTEIISRTVARLRLEIEEAHRAAREEARAILEGAGGEAPASED